MFYTYVLEVLKGFAIFKNILDIIKNNFKFNKINNCSKFYFILFAFSKYF